MTYKTKGIVLRTVKYGETSLIINIYTELFGVQAYLVNGVRTSTSKGPGKANLFQPAAILDLLAYHSELKNLQRLREFRWEFLYKHLFFDIVKNSIALFMIELLQKCLKQPEPNQDLFHFVENALLRLDEGEDAMVANFPLFFTLHLAGFLGFQITDSYTDQNGIFDLEQGSFVPAEPSHSYFLQGEYSAVTAQLLKTKHPMDLLEIRLNREKRRVLLQAYLHFYAVHLPDFGTMKSFPILEAILTES
jgi:DNA repair protein RecO (recombination protein O)